MTKWNGERYALDMPAIEGGTVKEGHARYCRENGHAYHTHNGVLLPLCPRCGDKR